MWWVPALVAVPYEPGKPGYLLARALTALVSNGLHAQKKMKQISPSLWCTSRDRRIQHLVGIYRARVRHDYL